MLRCVPRVVQRSSDWDGPRCGCVTAVSGGPVGPVAATETVSFSQNLSKTNSKNIFSECEQFPLKEAVHLRKICNFN